MKLVGWMTAISAVSALVVTLLPGIDDSLAVWLGMLGPLAITAVGWLAVESAYRKGPESLTAVQVRLFVGKVVFVGAYIIAILGTTPARPAPFAVSFTAYFVGLYVAEAMALHRLLQHRRVHARVHDG